jgi:uncharacterized membrane protein YhaH (DUF805 family)
MSAFAAMFSTSGQLAPKPFALGAVAVYGVSFLSQFLLAAPITARASIVPFLLVQGVIAWLWYALHVRRLRDAGRSIGVVVALTAIYVLAIVLLLLVMVAVQAPGSASGAGSGPFTEIFQVFLLLFLIGSVFSDPNLSVFGFIVLGVLALVMLPILIAAGFTIWAATRPRALAAPVSVLTQP